MRPFSLLPAALIAAFLTTFAAASASAQAQLDVTATPNNFTIAAGSSQTITVATHNNSSTPATATQVTYTLQITPDFAGGSNGITTNTPQVSTRTGNPAPNDWTPVSITITVPPGTAAGQYSGPLTGNYQYSPGNFTNYEFLVVNLTVTNPVPAQDFSITAAPGAITLTPGASQQVVFSATGTNGFAGPITVNAPPVPNVTIAPQQFVIAPGQQQTVTFTATATATTNTTTANFGATASANGTTVNHLVPVTVSILQPPQDFSLAATPSTVTLSGGASQQVSVAVQSANGFNAPVSVTATSSRNDITVTPSTLTISPGAPQTITISAAPNAQGGSASIQLSGTAAPVAGARTANISVNVLTPTPQPDFSVNAIAAPPSVQAGTSTRITFTIVPSNGFNGAVQITPAAAAGITFTPPSVSATPSSSGVITAAIAPNATAGALNLSFTATSGTIQHTAQSLITITPAAVGGPVITSLAPPSIVRGAVPVTLRASGSGFVAGATAFSDSPSIRVLRTVVITPQLADVTLSAAPDANLRQPYTLKMRNPNGATTPAGATLFVFDQDAIGAPLGVRAAAIVFPVEGAFVSTSDSVYPRALLGTTGSGTLYGEWRLDGIAYESFVATVQAGMPVEVRGRTAIPATAWGEHQLTVAVATRLEDLAPNSDRLTVAPAITIVSTPIANSHLTLYAPADRAIIGRTPPRFRWTIIPGASGYDIEIGTAVSPAVKSIRVPDPSWTPTAMQVRALGAGTFNWRVRPIFAGEVRGDASPERAIVVLPEAVSLHIEQSGNDVVWSGGALGVFYRVDVLDSDGAAIVHALTVRSSYLIRTSLRSRAAMLRVTPTEPDGTPLGRPVITTLRGLRASATSASRVSSIAGTPNTSASDWPRVGASWNGKAADDSILLLVDGLDVTPLSHTTPAGIVYDAVLPMAAGKHVARLVVGTETASWTFDVDGQQQTPPPDTPPSPAAPPAAAAHDYTITPMGDITVVHGSKNSIHAQLTGQGDIQNPDGTGTQFNGDLSYRGANNPESFRQESRNWVGRGSATQGATTERVTLGYTAPDFTDGAEFLTSGVARTGTTAKVITSAGTFSYYQPVNTAVHSLVSGNPENLRIRSAALETPSNKPWLLRAIGLEVDQPISDDTVGTRLRTIGLFAKYDIKPWLSLGAEAARGRLTAECDQHQIDNGLCPATLTRSGDAFRLGLTGSAGTSNYSLILRRVGANFVNSANRGFTTGGVADRTSGDLNFGRQLGKANINVALRRQDGGRSKDSTSARTSQSGANVTLSMPVTATTMLSITGSASKDHGKASEQFFTPATDRQQTGANASLTEMIHTFSVSESIGYQRSADHVTPTANQHTTNANLTIGGAPVTNVNLSVNFGAIRSAADPTVGTTMNYTASFQPSIAIPKLFLSFQPRVGWNRSSNDLTHSTNESEQYAAMLQFAPQAWGSLVSAQASADWGRNTSDYPGMPSSRQMTRRYQAAVNIHWGGLHSGAAEVPQQPVPGATPQPPPENPPATVSH